MLLKIYACDLFGESSPRENLVFSLGKAFWPMHCFKARIRMTRISFTILLQAAGASILISFSVLKNTWHGSCDCFKLGSTNSSSAGCKIF